MENIYFLEIFHNILIILDAYKILPTAVQLHQTTEAFLQFCIFLSGIQEQKMILWLK